MAESDVLAQIAELRAAAKDSASVAARARVVVEQKKAQLTEMTQRLRDEFACETWQDATVLLAELSKQTKTAIEAARAALVAEGIISE